MRKADGRVIKQGYIMWTGEGGATDVAVKPSKAPSQIKESNGQKKSAEKTSTKERKVEIPVPRLQFDDEHRVAKQRRNHWLSKNKEQGRAFQQGHKRNHADLYAEC